MKEATGMPPRLWVPALIGFGQGHYVYASGHEGDDFLTGFSPRKGKLSLYFMAGLDQRFATQIKKLGKAKAGKGGCPTYAAGSDPAPKKRDAQPS